MIQSTGITINDFYIPPFSVGKGDIVIIQLPNGPYFTDLLSRLVEILIGNEQNSNVRIEETFRFVKPIIDDRWRLTRILKPLTVERYIKIAGNPAGELPQKIYELMETNPVCKINRLAGTPRKLLAVATTLFWTKNIIFDLTGVDPVGGQKVYDLVKTQIGSSGAAILIDSYDDFREICTKFIKFELAGSEVSNKR